MLPNRIYKAWKEEKRNNKEISAFKFKVQFIETSFSLQYLFIRHLRCLANGGNTIIVDNEEAPPDNHACWMPL